MGDLGNATGAKLTLYTNHGCPWAHRAHIALKELALDYDEVIIDLATPREEWYLKINPRGLVPALKYEHPSLPQPIIIIESALVVHFLIDAFASRSTKLLPPPNTPEAAYLRYRIGFFVDTYFNKVQSAGLKMMAAKERPALEEAADGYVNAVKEHIEPLLHDASPFFGGSKNVTLAEVQTGSFILRIYDLSNDDLQPKSLVEKLDQLPNFSKWAKHVRAQNSVTYIWDKEVMIKRTTERRAFMQAKLAGMKI